MKYENIVLSTLLSQLNPEDLLAQTRRLASDERQITLQLIEHLREVVARMLYAKLGFGSLFEFTVKYLGLSEGSAHRRISAMRLMRDEPCIKEKLQSGALTVTNAAKIQVALNKVGAQNKNAPEDAVSTSKFLSELVDACAYQTQSQCDQILFQKLPTLSKMLPDERIQCIGTDQTEIKLVVSNTLFEKINELNQMISHANPAQKIVVLLERLVEQELKRRSQKRELTSTWAISTHSTSNDSTVGQSSPETRVRANKTTRAIPLAIQRQVFARAKNRCQFHACQSTYQLQIDHLLPKAFGGGHELENLRLLCRTHNLYEAKRLLGNQKIERFLRK